MLTINPARTVTSCRPAGVHLTNLDSPAGRRHDGQIQFSVHRAMEAVGPTHPSVTPQSTGHRHYFAAAGCPHKPSPPAAPHNPNPAGRATTIKTDSEERRDLKKAEQDYWEQKERQILPKNNAPDRRARTQGLVPRPNIHCRIVL